MRKIICAVLITLLAFPCDVVFSQRRAAVTRAKKARKSKAGSGSKSTKTPQKASTSLNKEVNDNGKPLSCSEKYNLCMDNVCVNENGLRYLCDTSTDSMETVERDGEKFRIGNDLYTFAKGECIQVLKSCDLAERNHIQTTYMAKIKEDLLTKNYIDAMTATSDETQRSVFEEYKTCMSPLCGEAFSDCFTISKIERRSPNCENILKKSSKPLSVKRMFYDEMEKQRNELCRSQGGYVDYDTKVCKVTVDFGDHEMIKLSDGQEQATGKIGKKVSSRTFYVGEIVECTQDFFATQNVERPFLGAAIKDFVMGGVKALAGVGLIVVGALATVGTFGGASIQGVPMMANGGALICKGSATALNGAIKYNTTKRKGACFINGVYVADLNTYFKITFWN